MVSPGVELPRECAGIRFLGIKGTLRILVIR
jgi:hypothetical protein